MASISYYNYILSILCKINLFAILSYCNIIVIALLLSIPCNMMTILPVSSMEAPSTSSTLHISTACNTTLHPKTCLATLLPFAASAASADPMDLFHNSLEVAIDDAGAARGLSLKLKRNAGGGKPTAVDDCAELLDVSFCQLCDVRDHGRSSRANDIQTWLSAALTNQQTCIDGLADLLSENAELAARSDNVSELISNSLALFLHAGGRGDAVGRVGGGRKLLKFGGYNSSPLFPAWTTAAERKLLGASREEMGDPIVVAKDGSGAYSTIVAAVEAAKKSKSGGKRVVIYVKAGVYEENVMIDPGQKNVMLVGDGMGKTVITSDRSVADGWTTFRSATFAAIGEGFMARDITFQNTAGPAKHQAVALRIGSDKAVIYRCSVEGYQDSLYAHSNRQFYRDTDVYGTVDFIFGNAAAVFQNCNIYPRKPSDGHLKNYVTAQGRTDPNQNTGFSIHSCSITAAADLAGEKDEFPTFLGRPWQKYSRTVVMQTYMDESVNPAGWEKWIGEFALSSLYYGEYMNRGPGAATGGRVSWPGSHPEMSTEEANKFTVAGLIFGNTWLPATGVQFDSGLHL